jgi:hypothetical protein
LPWALVVLLIPFTGKMVASQDPEMQYWAILPFGFGVLFFLIGCVKLWESISSHSAELFTQHQEALSMTPLVLLSQNMKQMHPEAVRVLNRFGVRTSWEVRLNGNLGERDWVLMGTNVHFGFIEFVLSRSGKALYPKRNLSQGSTKWDPDGLVEDRLQHEEFELWMFFRLMVTRSHGDFKPAEFIPPWTPALILETMGLTGEQDLYRPDEEPRKDLGSPQPAQASKNGNGHKVQEDGRDLTDEDMAAIERVQAENAARYYKIEKEIES